MKPYSDYTPEELAYSIDYARRAVRRLERSDHPRAAWSARVMRRNIKRMEAERKP